MVTEEELKSYIKKMPDEMTINELIDYLVKVEKLKGGNSNAISEEELKSEIRKMIRDLN